MEMAGKGLDHPGTTPVQPALHWMAHDDVPMSGSKIVALFADGSGARLLFIHDDGAIDAEGDDYDFANADFWTWAYLPARFTLWCETSAEPLKLPLWEGAPSSAKQVEGEGSRDDLNPNPMEAKGG